MNHLLLTAPIALTLWKQFATCAGIPIEGRHLLSTIINWWEYDIKSKWKNIINAVPGVIVWEL